jgi:hypothetical protein
VERATHVSASGAHARTGALVAGKTLFLPLDALYPECRVFTRPCPQIRPLACVEDNGCHLGLGVRCMESLARRLGRLFDAERALEVVLLHWQLPGGEHRGVAFDRAFSAPRVAPLRASVLRHYLTLGVGYVLPDEILR